MKMHLVLILRINKEIFDLLEWSMWKEDLPTLELTVHFLSFSENRKALREPKVNKEFFLSDWKWCYEIHLKLFIESVPEQIINWIFRITSFWNYISDCLTDEF